MKAEQFTRAMEIIGQSHSTKVIINYCKAGETVKTNSENMTIHITECCAAVINNLMNNGYKLSMTEGKTQVTKY